MALEERIIAADPVEDPQGYQRELLALLGGDDPVTVLAATPATWRELTGGLAAELLGQRPAAGEWSAAELLGHLWDGELAYAFRARAILAQDTPRLIGYDQDAWAALPHPPFGALLDAFAALRAANLALVRGIPEALWERVGIHEERGPTSFRLLTETMAGHDRAHLRQLEQTLAAVQGQPGGRPAQYQMAIGRERASRSGGSGRHPAWPAAMRVALQAAAAASSTSSTPAAPADSRSSGSTIPAPASRRRRSTIPAQVFLPAASRRPASAWNDTSGCTSYSLAPASSRQPSTSRILGASFRAKGLSFPPVSAWHSS